jgi:phosphoglycerate kinase
MAKLSIRDVPDSLFAGKRTFIRVDYNVPIADSVIQDDTRVGRTLPTLHYLLERNARIILASHLGRPKGEVKPELTLKPVAERLSELLGRKVAFAQDCVGDDVLALTNDLRDGDVVLLENLRFHPEEKANDPRFCEELAGLGDVYVNDAFGTAHRAHASVSGIAEFFDHRLSGFLFQRELEVLGEVRDRPKTPFVVILGGAKVKDKIGVIRNLLDRADSFLIGGGMAYTFLSARGHGVGDSILDSESLGMVSELLEKGGEKLLLPLDHVVARDLSDDAEPRVSGVDIADGLRGGDVGPETLKTFLERIDPEGTYFWNGPLGVFEVSSFSHGTMALAERLREVTSEGAVSVIGGGDTVSAIHRAGIEDSEMSHVSTGGGASLEFMAGVELPGVVSLSEK